MDDLLTIVAALFPPVLAVLGVGYIWYASRIRTPADVEQDVLAALSERDALPIAVICNRPPLAGQPVDPAVVHFTLEHLRRRGRLVRWADGDQTVYRRIA
jgi:hypothetical protein